MNSLFSKYVFKNETDSDKHFALQFTGFPFHMYRTHTAMLLFNYRSSMKPASSFTARTLTGNFPWAASQDTVASWQLWSVCPCILLNMTDAPRFHLGLYCVLPTFFLLFQKPKILAMFLLCFINCVTSRAWLLATGRAKFTLHMDRRFCYLEVLRSATKTNLCSTGDLVVSEQWNLRRFAGCICG
jgi:hypothetical protein